MGAFILMYALIAVLYYLQERTRLSKETELESHLLYIECMRLQTGQDCQNISLNTKPKMKPVYDNILYAFFILMLVIIPMSLLLSLFSIRPVRQATSLIDSFIANIVHDINTPISTIMLNAKSLVKRQDIKEKGLTRIISSAEQMNDMQHDLMALANENTDIDTHEVDLRSVIEEIVDNFEAKHTRQPFDVDIGQIILYANSVDVRRIVQNLISNAIKYNKSNNIIKLYTQSHVLFIQDSGKGMKNPEKVFDRNYREYDYIEGSGIGLASVLAMIERNSIEIEVISEVDEGTTVSLNLKKVVEEGNG